MNFRSAPESQSNDERALTACGLWLVIGFAGASALAAGMLQLFDGEANWLSALALIVGGGILTAASWNRAHAELEDREPASANARPSSTETVHRMPPRRRAGQTSVAGGLPLGSAPHPRRLGRS
jgi:hypothetical protein